jgi:hypothetical protein
MQFGDASILSTFEDGMIPSSPYSPSLHPPFENNSNRRMDPFQKNILNRLHEHTFLNIILNMICILHHVHLRLCINPSSRAWFFAHLTIP